MTTVDFDFFLKIRRVAETPGGSMMQPFPVLSTVYRIQRVRSELQLDLTSQIHGAASFNSLRSRIALGMSLFSISLKKPSKSPAKKRMTRTEKLGVMRDGSELDLVEMIRFRLALPVHKRTNFLRKRPPGGGSCL